MARINALGQIMHDTPPRPPLPGGGSPAEDKIRAQDVLNGTRLGQRDAARAMKEGSVTIAPFVDTAGFWFKVGYGHGIYSQPGIQMYTPLGVWVDPASTGSLPTLGGGKIVAGDNLMVTSVKAGRGMAKQSPFAVGNPRASLIMKRYR